MDSDKSFYIVVDGRVQVFAQTAGSTVSSRDKYDDEDNNGYQLLNNVENGGTLSSLFTILALFTENVSLRYEDDPLADESEPSSVVPDLNASTSSVLADLDVPSFHLDKSITVKPNRDARHGDTFYVDTDAERTQINARPRISRLEASRDGEGTIARATIDTTLAVIPAEAFLELTKKFPSARSHIVQGLFRICWLTLNLGLTFLS